MKICLLICLSILSFISCQKPEAAKEVTPPVEQSASQNANERVWVIKSDGSKSCQAGSGLTIEGDKKRLEEQKIQVFEAKKDTDGQMHLQVCGTETGSVNSFLILKSDLQKALALGFKSAASGSP